MNLRAATLTRADLALRVFALALCSYFTLFFLYSVFANFWPGPFVDYWIDIPNVEKFFNGQLAFHDLISAHANVHRLLIPRLLFIADYRFVAGSNLLLVWAALLCKLITLLLFNHIIRNESLQTRLLVNTLLFAAILNAANLSNVLHNSNMQWDLASVFACLAIYFYSRDGSRLRSIGWAWLFFTCGFLSQAGALPVIFVFVFISLLNKKWLESVVSLLMAIAVLYLTFAVLPVNEPEKPTYESAVAMLFFKLKYVALYVFKMFSGSLYPLDDTLFVFSWIVLGVFLLSLALSHKTRAVYHNVFLSIALFAFLMMITIAAARVDFSPNTWSANRYQTNVLLFILALSLHSYFSLSHWLGASFDDKNKKIIQRGIFIFSLGSFIITQYLLGNYAVIFSNKVFSAQAYMLTHGVNQNNGAGLLPSLQEHDRIAASDPLFRQHGFAWYANKQASDGFYRNSKTAGEIFLTEENKNTFFTSCSSNPGNIQYNTAEAGEGFEFSTPLASGFLSAVFFRNTYYVLDHDGTVVGFSYLFVNPDHLFNEAAIKGYVTTPAAQYIAEINRAGEPVCLHALMASR